MILTVTLNAAIDKTHLIPGFGVERVNRPAEVIALAGGKGINVARVLTTLGQPTLATGLVAGHAGAFIEDCVKREGIPHAFMRLPAGESRTCLAVVHPETGTTTEINESGAPVDAAAFQAFMAMYRDLLPDAEWVALSGSMPPGLDGEACLAMMKAAREAGKRVTLDTSGPPLARALAGRPDIVKPNQHEAEDVLGFAITPETLGAALSGLIDRGAGLVALTLGGSGAAIATPQEAYFFTAPAVRVVNPIGSGDSFLAGLLAGLTRGRALAEAGALGVACGSANAAVAGAAACPSDLIQSLLPHVSVAPLDEAHWAVGTFA